MDRVEPSSAGGGAGMEGGGTLAHTRRGESRAAVYGVVLLLVWVVVAFGQVFGGRFTTWDDDVWVERNAALAPPSGVGLGKKWLDAVDGGGVFQNLYTPVTHTVWFGVAKMGWDGTKLDPGVFKAASVGVHLVGVVGVFLLVRGVLRAAGAEGRACRWGALVGAGVFGLHPMQVESVAWVSGMKDVLWTALMVWALVLFVGGITGRGLGKGLGGWVGIGGAWVLLGVALLTKPTAVVVPGMMMVIAMVVGGGRHGVVQGGKLGGAEEPRMYMRGFGGWRVVVGVLVACLLVVPVALVTARWQTAPLVEAVGWWWRPVVAMDAVGHYIGKVVWPVGFALDYGRSPRWVVSGGHWVWNVGVFGVAVGLLAWWRDRVAVGGAVMAVMAVGPVLGLVDFDFATFSVVSDHYGYALMVGVAVVVGAGVAGAVRWAERGATVEAAERLGDGGNRGGKGESTVDLAPATEGKSLAGGRLRVVGGVVVVWLGVLSGLTWVLGGVWRDSATLYQHGLEVVPGSAMMNSNYAAWLQTTAVRMPRGEWEGMMRASLMHAGRAIERFEKYPQAHYLAGIAEAFLGKPEAALKHYAVAAPYFAKYADFQAKLGDVYAELGRLDEAARHYRKALEIDPQDVGAGRMLPRVQEELNRRATTQPGVTGGG